MDGAVVDGVHRAGAGVYEQTAKVRNLRIALAVLAGVTLVVTGVLGGVATTLNWDGLLTPTGALHPDGTFSVTEDIEVEWHEPRRGLIRDIDRSAPDGLLVEVDGTPTLRWDTFGDQWDTLIEQATVTLELPDGRHDLGCVIGALGEASACEGDGPSWSAQELRPGRGITVEARLDADVLDDAVDPAALPEADLDPLDEFSTVALQRIGLVVAISGAAALPLLGTFGGPANRRRRREARERLQTTGVTYVPPSGMRPSTAGLLVHGEAGAANDDQLFGAWLLEAQQRDLIEVEPRGKGFRVRFTGRDTPDSEPEAAALRALVPDLREWITWGDKTPDEQARRFEGEWQDLRAHHTPLAGVPSHVAARIGPLGVVVGLVGVAAAVRRRGARRSDQRLGR